jgi:pSer/pThr/pTyr-binding forkhead associated (FHA) protein
MESGVGGMSLQITIQVVKHGHLIERQEFDVDKRRVIKIGNSSAADLRIEEPNASRLHAVIEVSGGHVLARDLATSSGTIINGARTGRAALGPYNEIVIGNTILQVAVQQAEQPRATDTLAGSIGSMSDPQLDELTSLIAEVRRSRVPVAAPPPALPTWQPPVPPGQEKYDTLKLQAIVRRDTRRGNVAAFAAFGAMVALLASPFFAGAHPTKTRAIAAAEAAMAPEPAPAPVVAPPAPPPEPVRAVYVVQSGDTLGTIAASQLGDAKRWHEIVEANPALNPDSLSVGAELVLPADH